MTAKKFMETGQDWSSDVLTQAEYQSMAAWYTETHGVGNLDLCKFLPFMMDLRPDSLKKYRRWTEIVPSGTQMESGIAEPSVLVWLHYYTINAYRDGYLYEVIMARGMGCSKAEIAQTTVLGWLHGGPRGLNTAAASALEYMADWKEDPSEAKSMKYPDGWAPDADAFRSGIDLDPNRPMTVEDRKALDDWHVRLQGEVPDYVPVLAEFNPGALKVFRARYENAAVGPLPKQFIALLQVHQALMMREPQALRRAVHMARHFGVTRNQVGQIIGSAQLYLGDLGMESLGAVRSMLDKWEQ